MKHLKLLFCATITLLLTSGYASAQKFEFPISGGGTIPDNGCGWNELILTTEVKGIGVLDFANGKTLGYVFVDIEHSFASDVDIYLTSPEGTTVTLTSGNGGNGDDYDNTYFAGWSTGNPISSGNTPFSGYYDPEDPLSDFSGEWADGTWTLKICDDEGGQVGRVLETYMRFNINSKGPNNTSKFKLIHANFDQGDGKNEGYGGGAFTTTNFYKATDQFNQFNQAYRFDGTNFITLGQGDEARLNPTWSATLAVWCQPSNVSNTQALLGKSDNALSNRFRLGLKNGQYHALVEVAGDVREVLGGTPVAGQWDHVAMTYGDGGSLILFVNGVEQGRTAVSSLVINSMANGEAWRAGADSYLANADRFVGRIDQIGVWSYPLKAAAIREHASAFNGHCRSAMQISAFGNSCSVQRYSQNYGGWGSPVANPGCAGYTGGDLWFKVEVPSSGRIAIQTTGRSGQVSLTDMGMAVYSGDCDNLQRIACNDDGGSGNHSKITLTSRQPGETLYIRVWEYNNDSRGFFGICAWSPALVGIKEAVAADRPKVYPNPTQGILQLDLGTNSGKVEVQLHSLTGQQLLRREVQAARHQLDLQSFPAGVYLLTLRTGSEVFTQKIIRQ